MIAYYDMYGMPVSMERWGQLLRQPKHVAQDHITIRGQRFWISTVWLGLDHNFTSDGPPLIFETMVFPDDGSFQELYCARYPTRERALIGHRRFKRLLRRDAGIVRAQERHEPVIHNGGKPKRLAGV